MTKAYRETRIVTWENKRWLPGQGYVVDSTGSSPVTIEIDIDGLFNTLGHKAARAKGKRAVVASGLIVAKRVTS